MTNTGSAAPLRPALSEPHGELPGGDVGAWLLTGQGPLNAAERALAASVKDRDRQWPARLGKVLKAALGQEIVAALRTVLEQSVVDILIEGWGNTRRYWRQPTRRHPGPTRKQRWISSSTRSDGSRNQPSNSFVTRSTC
jgi:hypothetical protein